MKTWMFALALGLAAPASADEIRFVTEDYAPFNYSKDGTITGIAVDQVHRIAKAAGIDYSIDIMPWARAIALAESQPMHCVFTTGHNKERHDRFGWVEPLLKDRMVMVRRNGGAAGARTLDDAKALRIGSQRGDFAVEALNELGFTEIDVATDIEITLGKLLSGRIDLMPTSVKTFEKMVKNGHPVEKAMLLDGQIYGIACNRAVPPDIIARMQAALDTMIMTGEQDAIFARYGLPPDRRTATAR